MKKESLDWITVFVLLFYISVGYGILLLFGLSLYAAAVISYICKRKS